MSRRVPEEVRAALGDAGLFAMVAPADYGGLDIDLPELWLVVETIAEVDATVSWHLANSGIAGLASLRLDSASRQELYADPRFPYGNGGVPAGRAIAVEGGYRLSGRWPFITGADHTRWNALAGLVTSPGDAAVGGGYGSSSARIFIVPSSVLKIERTWDEASGMRGTGSHAVHVENTFVPTRFAPSWADPPTLSRPWTALPRALGFGGMMASIMLGILHGGRHADQPRHQLVVGEAEAAWQAMQASWHQTADRLWDAATARDVGAKLRAEAYGQMFHIVDTVRRNVSELYSVSTNAAYRTQNRVDRALRDAHAASAGIESFRGMQFDAARVLAGGEAHSPAF